LAVDTLQEMGFNVAHLDGGITAWREEGHPVEEGRPG
jgi:rhodanese-related sulfurtransferase